MTHVLEILQKSLNEIPAIDILYILFEIGLFNVFTFRNQEFGRKVSFPPTAIYLFASKV